jgi:hypothetical protein
MYVDLKHHRVFSFIKEGIVIVFIRLFFSSWTKLDVVCGFEGLIAVGHFNLLISPCGSSEFWWSPRQEFLYYLISSIKIKCIL